MRKQRLLNNLFINLSSYNTCWGLPLKIKHPHFEQTGQNQDALSPLRQCTLMAYGPQTNFRHMNTWDLSASLFIFRVYFS